jgi:hypothetical protein
MNPTTHKAVNYTLTAMLAALIVGNIALAIWQTHVYHRTDVRFSVTFGETPVLVPPQVMIVDKKALPTPPNPDTYNGIYLDDEPQNEVPKEKPKQPRATNKGSK